METLKITNGFNRLSDAALLERSTQIVTALQEHFATAPNLAELATARDEFNNALATAKDGSALEKAIKNQKKEDLIDKLHLMANYILFICAGDRVKAVSSGFSIAKPPTPSPEVAKAENQKLEDGANAGELKFSFDKVPGARGYVYQATPEPLTENSNWSSSMGTVRRFLFSGLESGKRYWCRVAALGINGQAVYSDPVSRLVQ